MNTNIETDKELCSIIDKERIFQSSHLNLHPKENVMINAARKVLGSILTNKYSEGFPGARYYGGTHVIDKIELLCSSRLKQFLKLDKRCNSEWLVNIQCYSGSHAELAICMGILNIGDRIMRIRGDSDTALENFYQVDYYNLDKNCGGFDFTDLTERCRIWRPKILFVPSDVLTMLINYKQFSEICNELKILLVADISEIALLVSLDKYGGEDNDPFMYCDIIYSNTQSSLGGPKGGFLMVNNTKNPGLFQKVNSAVFPGLQGGPHNHQIGSFAVQLQGLITSKTSEFVSKALRNSVVLAQSLLNTDIPLLGDGTDTHLVAIDCERLGLPCEFISRILTVCGVRHTYRKFEEKRSSVMFGTLVYSFREGSETQMAVLGDLISHCIHVGMEIFDSVKKLEVSDEARHALVSEELRKNKELGLIFDKISGIVSELSTMNLD
ncbi:mitochondrial serine hydroxymethyl transferase [Cryptosporidium canis]|uniref:glycine hydroxymethyltransferase n=1 Tax=Cryptosporidium canis TaxID=195482 RepID=A0ABQ8PB42_9CRYT|nr:mitochondrial serine hydroxymethyl transferase [Cryptosporidium canis]KAJ1615086.1 mitochondrial serine hydroxymethyl transferase [Cryptosporidium canis]